METFFWCLFFFIFISTLSHLVVCAPATNSNVTNSSGVRPIELNQSNALNVQRKTNGKHETSRETEKKKPPKIEIFELEQKFNAYCIRYRVTGRPAPTKVWHLNGTVLDFQRFEGVKDKNYSSLNVNGTRYAMRSGKDGQEAQDGCLEITARSHFLSGNYSLFVRNELGEASQTKQVVLLTHPGRSASPELDELAKGKTDQPPLPPPNQKASGDSPIILSVSTNFIVLMLSLLLTSLFLYLACVRYLNHHSRKRSSHKPNGQGRMSLDLIRFVSFVDNPNYLAQKRQYLKGIQHVKSERIQLVEYLGEGEFGRVFLGTLETEANEKTMVAVKVLKVGFLRAVSNWDWLLVFLLN